MNQQGRMEKENKALGRDRCENIDTLYIFNNNNNNNNVGLGALGVTSSPHN